MPNQNEFISVVRKKTANRISFCMIFSSISLWFNCWNILILLLIKTDKTASRRVLFFSLMFYEIIFRLIFFISRCRVGENWWYRGEHCEEYVSEPLVVGIAIASVAGFLFVASGVLFFLARTLRDQYDKEESEDPVRWELKQKCFPSKYIHFLAIANVFFTNKYITAGWVIPCQIQRSNFQEYISEIKEILCLFFVCFWLTFIYGEKRKKTK